MSLLPPEDVTETTEPHTEEFDRKISVLHTPAGDLCEKTFVGRHGQPGLLEKHLLEGPSDVEKYLSLPRPRVQGDIDEFFCEDAAVGEAGIVHIGLGLNPAGHAADLCGTENFALMSVQHRGLLHELMQRRMDIVMELLAYCLARGGGPYFAMAGQEYVAPPIHGPSDFRDFNLRYDKPIIDRVHEAGGLIHIHCHGSLKSVLCMFREMQTDVLHPIEAPPMGDVTAQEARDILGDTTCIEGNIQIADMLDADEESIRAQAQRLIEEVWLPERRGLILAPTASPYLPRMTERMYRNYCALAEAALAAAR